MGPAVVVCLGLSAAVGCGASCGMPRLITAVRTVGGGENRLVLVNVRPSPAGQLPTGADTGTSTVVIVDVGV